MLMCDVELTWSGSLPPEGDLKETSATFRTFSQPIIVYGVVCLDSLWNSKDKICEIIPGCSLCRYFLASPCKLEFKAWERCMDISKIKDEAIEVNCMDPFLAMADCRSEHPEYFDLKRKKAPVPPATEHQG